jgi:hypothetical protein
MCFNGATVQFGAQTPNYVEDFACSYLSDWTSTFEVTVSETDTIDGTDMGAATYVHLIGIFQGRTLSANAILRREYEPESQPPPCP